MKANILTLAITLTIGVILAGSLLMPVINDATTTDKTFTNEGIWRMSEIENGMEWDFSNGTWELNDEVQATNTGTSSFTTINAIAGEDWLIRGSGYMRGTAFNQSNYTGPIVVAANDQITISWGTNSSTTVDLDGYGIDLTGDYMLSDYDKAVYVKGDSPIYATGQSSFGTARGIIHFEGSIKDGITGSINKILGDSYTDMTLADIEVDYEAVEGYVDLYKLNKITATASCVDSSSNTQTGTVTYSSYVVPYEVTAELSQHLDNGEIAILNAIPILIIVALVMMAVGALYLKRDD